MTFAFAFVTLVSHDANNVVDVVFPVLSSSLWNLNIFILRINVVGVATNKFRANIKIFIGLQNKRTEKIFAVKQ